MIGKKISLNRIKKLKKKNQREIEKKKKIRPSKILVFYGLLFLRQDFVFRMYVLFFFFLRQNINLHFWIGSFYI